MQSEPELSIKKKGKIFIANIHFPYYSREDFTQFLNVCDQIGLPALKNVIQHVDYDHDIIRGCIKSVSKGKQYLENFVHIQNEITDGQKKYHTRLYQLMFVDPYEEMAMNLHEDRDFLPIVEWRLRIGK